MSDNVTIKQDDNEMEVGLGDILGLDMAQVDAFEGGFVTTPKGLYTWECKDAGLDKLDTVNGARAVIYFECECQVAHAVMENDDGKDEENMVGWTHRETIFISDLAKSVGQAKAIMQNAGFTGSGTLEEMFDAFCGTQFTAPIAHRKDKNDTDRIYANFKVSKITPPIEVAA